MQAAHAPPNAAPTFTTCPNKAAIQISLAMYGSDRHVERVPRILEFSPRARVEIVPVPASLARDIPAVAGLLWEVL